MSLIEDLQRWKDGKARLFAAEGLSMSITPILGDEKQSRYVEVESRALLSRATLWDDGCLELEALEMRSGRTVLQASRVVATSAELSDSLNGWLSEIAAYVSPSP